MLVLREIRTINAMRYFRFSLELFALVQLLLEFFPLFIIIFNWGHLLVFIVWRMLWTGFILIVFIVTFSSQTFRFGVFFRSGRFFGSVGSGGGGCCLRCIWFCSNWLLYFATFMFILWAGTFVRFSRAWLCPCGTFNRCCCRCLLFSAIAFNLLFVITESGKNRIKDDMLR